MSKKKCHPEHWFLDVSEGSPHIALRHTGRVESIAKNTLLIGRAVEWGRQPEWKLPSVVRDILAESWTSGNLVTPLVDGKEYMHDLYDELQNLQKDEQVLLAGWQFTSKQRLEGPGKQGKGSALLDVLLSVIGRGCGLRVLAWDNIKIPTSWWGQNNRDFVNEINSAYPSGPRSAYVDANLDGTFLAHHQKEVVVYRPSGRCCAYVGGIDLGIDRWDDTEHKKKNKEGTFIAWHDIQVKVKGPAVMQLWANFAERWDNNNRWLKKKQASYSLKPCEPPAWDEKTEGTHHVQMLRTVTPVRSGFQERAMSHGEYTVLCALQKAISKAEHYIYIEEQFLWDCELADFIAAQRKARPALRLIIALAAETELPIRYGDWHYHRRSLFFQTVMGVKSKKEIAFGDPTHIYPYGIYRSDKKGVYVHSKLVIIDDRYVAVGSANFAARSLWVDTELTLGIVDGDLVDGKLGGKDATVCKFARDLRVKLWNEHLGTKVDAIDDPIEALNEFPGTQKAWPRTEAQAWKVKRGHTRCYVNIPGKDKFVNECWPNILDPSERHFKM